MNASVLLFLFSLAPSSELDRGVTRLIGELELPSLSGFSLDQDVAIAVAAEGKDPAESRALQRALAGLVRARLSATGLSSIVEATPPTDAGAREQGADWMLFVSAVSRSGKLRLHAELRKIDLGLWSKPPGELLIFATAEGAIDIDDALRTLPSIDPVAVAESDPSEGTRFDGGPQRIASLPDRVLALASCEVGSPFGEALFVLTRRSLFAYLYSSTGYARKAGALELGALDHAKERTREPFGSLVCSSSGREVALGSSDLKDGHIVRVRAQNHELALAIARPIAGIPVGELGPGKWATVRADGGRNRMLPVIEVDGSAHNVDAPLLDVVIDHGNTIAVTDKYRLVRYSEDLDAPVAFGTSGVGVSLIDGTPELAVATSSSSRERDRLRLIPLDKTKKEKRVSVEIDGAVYATTVAKLSPDTRAVIAAAYRDGRTELFAVPLKGAPR